MFFTGHMELGQEIWLLCVSLSAAPQSHRDHMLHNSTSCVALPTHTHTRHSHICTPTVILTHMHAYAHIQCCGCGHAHIHITCNLCHLVLLCIYIFLSHCWTVICTQNDLYTSKNSHTHIYIHTHTHTHMHTRTHTQKIG